MVEALRDSQRAHPNTRMCQQHVVAALHDADGQMQPWNCSSHVSNAGIGRGQNEDVNSIAASQPVRVGQGAAHQLGRVHAGQVKTLRRNKVVREI